MQQTFHAIYARVSTEDQARSGYSLADQVNTCRQRLLAQGISAIREYVDDGFSGEFLDRPALNRLRNDLSAKTITMVLVYDPDRLSRNLTNQLILAADIEKNGAKLDFVTGSYDASPEGRLFFAMRGAIAEFEKEKIRERSLRGKRAKVLTGKPLLGKEPFGYHCDRTSSRYVINDVEAEIVRTIYHLYLHQSSSIAGLETALRNQGIVARGGKPFTRSALHRILSNELYAGTKWSFQKYQKTVGPKKRKTSVRSQDEWIAVSVPAIVDPDTFAAAAALRNRNKTQASRNTKNEYLLQGIIKCPTCGCAMRGTTFPAKHGGRNYSYYVCSAPSNGQLCENRRGTPAKELDEAVWSTILGLFRTNGEGLSPSIPHPGKTDAASASARLKQLRIRQAAIIKWVTGGLIDLPAAERDLRKLGSQIAAIQRLPKETTKAQRQAPSLASIRDFEQKRSMLRRLGIVVKAYKGDTGDTFFKICLENSFIASPSSI